MSRSTLIAAYARRLVGALSSDLGSGVASVQRAVCEGRDAHVVEWKALLDSGVEIRLSAVILGSAPCAAPPEPSREDLEELRSLGISPESLA